jgi:hypothetical protein
LGTNGNNPLQKGVRNKKGQGDPPLAQQKKTKNKNLLFNVTQSWVVDNTT